MPVFFTSPASRMNRGLWDIVFYNPVKDLNLDRVHNGIEISEDYILVEFASKLEEDYHRLQANDNKLDEQHDHSDSH